MLAERDTVDRYLAAFFSDRIGLEVFGTISGVTRFGIFVKIDESGADGLVPVSTIGNEYFRYNREKQVLVAERTGLVLGLGKRVLVRVVETNALTGGLTLQLLSVDGEKLSVVAILRRVFLKRGLEKKVLGKEKSKINISYIKNFFIFKKSINKIKGWHLNLGSDRSLATFH